MYDLLRPDEFFKVGEREISALNCRIASAEASGELAALREEITSVQGSFEVEIAQLKEIYAAGKRVRERMREELEGERAVGEVAGGAAGVESAAGDAAVGKGELLARMVRESQFQKAEIKRAEKRMREALEPLQGRFAAVMGEIEGMKELRKVKSAALQEEIFRHFVFFNARGEKKDLLEIFKDYYSGEVVLPPGGAGECAAPKLLQYAYLHGMRPVAMGEFWYGDSPKGEIRHHGEFYPSCKGKCAPILGFMLQGLDVDEAGVHSTYGQAGSLEILYSDEHILAVNKPAGVLSQDSLSQGIDVFKLLSFSENLSGEKLYVVHRLDMHTSGVLLLARSEEVYKELQRQFAAREVEKVYYAVLEGEVTESGCGSAIFPSVLSANRSLSVC